MRIGFLLNHDAAHQAAHSVPVALALAEPGRHTVVILVTSRAEADVVADIASGCPGSRIRVERLRVPGYVRLLDVLTGRALGLKRIGLLWRYRRRLAGFDALAVPEKTSALLKNWLGRRCPRLINIRHGAGDRACGNFGRGMSRFDLHLLPGPKYERLLLEAGLARAEDYAVIGYPKLEYYASRPRPRYFDNGRPVVVYAPHFDPQTSSWYRWGRDILEFFAASVEYNLIFAPHVLLFARRWHVSGNGGRPRMTGGIPTSAIRSEHILVDRGSRALVDMSYMRAADIYLGDVSSQVYEFLHRPRPCVFLNPARIEWRGDPRYRFWNCGRVVADPADLPAALADAGSSHERYLPAQRRAFADTFSVTDEPASRRGARAILSYLQKTAAAGAGTREA